jgi:CRP-like cAMP-binding protein
VQPAKPDRATLLALPLFTRLSDADCDALAVCLRLRRIEDGDALFREGAPGDTMAFVVEGELASRHTRGATTIELGRTGAGGVVGEMACIDPAPRSADVVAVGPVVVAELSRDHLAVLERAAPRVFSLIVGKVVTDLTRRMRELDARIDEELFPGERDAGREGPASAPLSVSVPLSASTPLSGAGPRTAAAEGDAPSEPRRGLWGFLDRLRGRSA